MPPIPHLDIPSLIHSLWTSAAQLNGLTFCRILNEAIRSDELEISSDVVSIVKGFVTLSVMSAGAGVLPSDLKVYRGGGLPDQYMPFFSVGKMYRTPMLLSTSSDWVLCQKIFCYIAQMEDRLPPVLYVVQLDGRDEYECVSSVVRPQNGMEREFVFWPYNVFEVSGVVWRERPTWQYPHVVYVSARGKGGAFEDDLPLAMWH